MIRILYIVSTLRDSGPTNQLYGLTSNLCRDLYEPIILTLSPEPRNSRLHDFEQAGITVESLNNQRLSGMLCNRSGISKAISRYQPQIIHTQGFRAGCLLSKISHTGPWITTIRNDPWLDYPMKFGRLQGSWMAWKDTRAIRHATVAVCCSQTIETAFREKYKAQNVQAVQNGVDIVRYHPADSAKRENLREKLGFPGKTKIFLSLSTLVKRKDIGTLIRGFQLSDLDNSKLIVLGNGPERPALEAIASPSSNIEFLGNVTNVNEYLAAADFLISSSLSEGLPNSVLEAMASGMPAVLSDIPSHREVLQTDTVLEEFLFPIKDKEKLANTLQKITKTDYPKISTRVRSLIEESFSSEIMSRKYQTIYGECIKKSGGQCG